MKKVVMKKISFLPENRMDPADSLDIEIVSNKTYKISCCRSYLTPKGRCYTCPEEDLEHDPDEEE